MSRGRRTRGMRRWEESGSLRRHLRAMSFVGQGEDLDLILGVGAIPGGPWPWGVSAPSARLPSCVPSPSCRGCFR